MKKYKFIGSVNSILLVEKNADEQPTKLLYT